MAFTAATRAGSEDCNNNGIPDAAEIAAGLIDDCNGNGIPDPCEYAGVELATEQAPFGSGSSLILTVPNPTPAVSDVRLSIAVRADLDSVGEFVQARIGGSVVATLWITGGQACPASLQTQTVIAPAATFNAGIGGGGLVMSLETSAPVGLKDCPTSFASLEVGYVGTAAAPDCLGNGVWDACDLAADPSLDCNGNGLIDLCEIDGDPSLDCDANNHIDLCEIAADPSLDCDANGIVDSCDLAADPSLDCDGSGQIDSCEIAADPSLDCDGSGLIDACEIAGNPSLDCDVNGLIDSCDIGADPSLDCDGNGFIDLCEIAGNPTLDCNANGVLDTCDIATDPLLDCDGSGFIDLCEVAGNPSLDCNGNGLIDACEIATDPSLDCDSNGIDDTCEVAVDPGLDCDQNGELDSCDLAADPTLDCDGNGIIDACQIVSASSLFCVLDCDGDGVLDACQLEADPAVDKNGNAVLDACEYTKGDFTLDGAIDGADLAFLLALWGSVNSPIGDLNEDGLINGADLAQLLGGWGTTQIQTGCWAVVLEVEPDPAVITDPEWRARIIATGLPWRVQDNASGIEMLLVPSGTFLMGCSASLQQGCNGDENPVHQVTLTQAFYLGRYEVTQAQWTAVMGSNPSYFQSPGSQVPASQVPNRPVERVSWNMIQGFEEATGLRLPTETEWEYACRAGTQTAFNLPPNGTNNDGLLGLLGWFSSNSASQTRPVGQKKANSLGLYDLHGNVWEWVEDWYDSGYYAQSPEIDPPGPISGSNRVLRGGSWYNNSYYGRSSYRFDDDPGNLSYGFGFRAARTP